MTRKRFRTEGGEGGDADDLQLVFDRARASDLPEMIALLAADRLGATRERSEDPLPSEYRDAYLAIDGDPNQEMVVARTAKGLAGMLQLTFIPSLTYRGAWRAQIEGVRVVGWLRSRGVGRQLVEYAIERAATRRCRIVQLTTDKHRPRARAFYERLGFVSSHVGMKLHLTSRS